MSSRPAAEDEPVPASRSATLTSVPPTREATPRGAGARGGRAYRQARGVFVGVDDVALPPHYTASPEDRATRGWLGTIGAVHDVEALSAAMAPVLASPPICLTGARATRARVLAQLEDAVQEAVPGDLVIAYFAAYALTEYDDLYLLPHDFEPGSVLATAVSFRLASAVLGSTPGVQSLIIVDACHAAAVGFDMSRYQVGAESGLMVSSGPSELSFSSVMDDGHEHGHFTWGLIKTLEKRLTGESWSLPVIDWFDSAYLLTVQRDPAQHPVFLGTLSPNLELRPRRRDDP